MTTNTSLIEIGTEFSNYEEFLRAFHDFCNTSYQPLTIIVTNNKKQVTNLCRHGRKRDLESKGKRPFQRFNYLGCGAKITCYKSSNSTKVKVTSVKLDHNHEVSADTFPFTELNEHEVEVRPIADLHEANCKISEIARVVKNKFDKAVSNQKIRNLVRKISPIEVNDCNNLQKFLENIEEESVIVDYTLDVDGQVSMLFVSSYAMRHAFLQSSCTTIQIDTSFNFDASKYKLDVQYSSVSSGNNSDSSAAGISSKSGRRSGPQLRGRRQQHRHRSNH
jgi:hypothetical protein